MKKNFAFTLSFVICITQLTSALNILALGCQNSKSHSMYLNAITNALLEKGHQIYELVRLPTPKHPNRTTFTIQEDIEPEVFDGFDDLVQRSAWQTLSEQALYSVANCEKALNSKAARELLALARNPQRRPKIDVVVIGYLFGQCLGAFAKEFGDAPIVAVTAYGNPVEVDQIMGAPTFPSFVSHEITSYSRHDTMTWTERLHNKMTYLMHSYLRANAESTMDEQLRQFFGDGTATIEEIRRNISVVLINSHPAFSGARPQIPAVVEVGGIHVPPLKGIPGGELKVFLDSANDGFILMSFGSFLRVSSMESWRRKELMQAFDKLKPLRIVMKWERPWNSDQDGPLPINVFLSQWLPQSDILGHHNVRLFVTHCGLLSAFETIARAVPIVGVPLFVDQMLNAKSLADVNVGKVLPYKDLNGESFYNTVRAVLNDKRYATSVRRLSSIIQDDIVTPKERAVYWVEFVARYGGAPYLRSQADKISWVARWMIDDILIIFVLVSGVMVAVRHLVKLCDHIRQGEKKMKKDTIFLSSNKTILSNKLKIVGKFK